MAESNVVVRRLDALEALGGVTDICSDKTGTLTQGKMVVRKGWSLASGKQQSFEVEQPGATAFEPKGRVLLPATADQTELSPSSTIRFQTLSST